MNRWIEIVIGRLLSDDEFRAAFLRDPHRALSGLGTPDPRVTQADTASFADFVAPWRSGRSADRFAAADTQPDNPLAE